LPTSGGEDGSRDHIVHRLLWGLTAIALASLPACGGNAPNSATTSTSRAAPATTTPATVAPSPPAVGPRTETWIDLEIGQCLADLPKIDLGAVTVTVVDCATPHTAEVFFRGPMWVDTTVPDVANRNCGKAFPDYTGQPVDGSPYTMTYLVDADQDRTSENPTAPGTLICLVEGANGRPLTGSARR
jgi:hypothetical protein